METLKKCLNPKVLIGLALVAVALFVFAPKFALASLPLLLIAACPLSMIVMMGMMGKKSHSNQTSQAKKKEE